MNMRRVLLCVGCLAAALTLPAVLLADVVIPIQISPSTIIKSAPVPSVTVHADIDFSLVQSGTVTLQGVAATSIFADNRGDLVAKFKFTEINALVSAPQATLTLRGMTKTGDAFTGTGTVAVRK